MCGAFPAHAALRNGSRNPRYDSEIGLLGTHKMQRKATKLGSFKRISKEIKTYKLSFKVVLFKDIKWVPVTQDRLVSLINIFLNYILTTSSL